MTTHDLNGPITRANLAAYQTSQTQYVVRFGNECGVYDLAELLQHGIGPESQYVIYCTDDREPPEED